MNISSAVSKDFLVIDSSESVSSLIGKLRAYEKRSALVFHHKKYVGLVQKRRLLRAGVDPYALKVVHVLLKTAILPDDTDIIKAARLLFESASDVLPVQKNKEIIGVVSALSLASLAVTLPEAGTWKVKDVKSMKSFVLQRGDPVAVALQVMHDQRIDQLPIVDQGELYGLLSYRDLLRKYLNWSPQRDFSRRFNKMASTRSAEVDALHLSQLPVEGFATTDGLLTTTMATTVREAVALMVKNNISCLPVMSGTSVNGLFSIRHVLQKVADLTQQQQFEIQFIGLHKLHTEDYSVDSLQRAAGHEAQKLQRALRQPFHLAIHVKEYSKQGHRHKYSVAIRLEYPGQFLATSDDDWDVEGALHKAFTNVGNALKKKLKL